MYSRIACSTASSSGESDGIDRRSSAIWCSAKHARCGERVHARQVISGNQREIERHLVQREARALW
jgi:hypothetical protein